MAITLATTMPTGRRLHQPTGHQHHFLSRLDRVSTEHVEVALELYRDVSLLRFVLSAGHLPEGAERAAISLEDPALGPFLVVTRDGYFVTCLGRGMRAGDLPVVTRAQLDARIELAENYRAQRAERRKLLGPDGGAREVIDRLRDAADELSREDFVSLSALQPLLLPRFFKLQGRLSEEIPKLREDVIRLLKRTEKPKPATFPALRALWKAFFSIGHATVLGTLNGPILFDLDPPFEPPWFMGLSEATVSVGIVEPALKGAWAVARLGERMWPEYEKLYTEGSTFFDVIDAIVSACALGLRHEGLRAEAREMLSAPPPKCLPVIIKLAEPLTGLARAVLDDPDTFVGYHRLKGSEVLAAQTAHLPPGHPHRYETGGDVPAELAMPAAVRNFDEYVRHPRTLTEILCLLPWTVRASAEELYLPADLLRVVSDPWEPEDTIRHVRAWIDSTARDPRPSGPARKGPCPCGSGKKYKHCCEKKEPAPA